MDTWRANIVFKDAGQTVVAVENVNSIKSKMSIGYQCSANIEPVAVIVCEKNRSYAIDMTGKIITVDQLRKSIPNIDSIIAPFITTH